MFGFKTQARAVKSSKLDDVVARHKANIAAERVPAVRSNKPGPAIRKKREFGKRGG